MQRPTCAGCPNLIIIDNISNWLAGCKATDTVVPHAMDAKSVTFWRVPGYCPLPDSEVEKRAKPQPKRKWVTMTREQMIATIPQQ